MNIQELMQRIHFPKEAQIVVLNNLIKDEEYKAWRELLYDDEQGFVEQWKTMESRLQWAMVFFLQLSCEVYEEYKKRGIEDQIFNDTFFDITLWTEDCYQKHHCWGLQEVRWIPYSIKMKLFRLGRLQFEPLTLDKDIEGSPLKEGMRLLNVHIPAGEKLHFDACMESLKKAEEFFGDSYEAYICDSWLLSPKLKDFLPKESNIIRFQDLFEIAKVHYAFPQAEQRIFGGVREDKENYPEDTLLQKKAKEYICKKNDIGIGIGYIYK